MIRYSISERTLKRRVQAESPTWFVKAGAHANPATAHGPKPNWSDIKAVYISLQKEKCAYCERPLLGPELGKNEWDVEHFRPKKGIVNWPPTISVSHYTFAPSPLAGPSGYPYLEFSYLNYCASCKTCNSRLKASYFPVQATYDFNGKNIRRLNAVEEPYLIYPIGTLDIDPESVITFDGFVARRSPTGTFPEKRAELTIEFFRLNSRPELLKQRCLAIDSLFHNLEVLRSSTDRIDLANARKMIKVLTASSSAQANCARCYNSLYTVNRPRAIQIHRMAVKYLADKSR